MASPRAALLLALVGCALASGSAGPAAAVEPRPVLLPAAGELINREVAVRAKPDPNSRVLRRFAEFRHDFRLQIVLALRVATGANGGRWFELSLPGRPNGGRGWVPAAAVSLHPIRNRIVVHRAARRLEIRRIADRKLLLRAPVSLGKPGAETPLGQNFYVQWRFVPGDPFYGSYALETSAYSNLSDWPGGGIVGIHGTSQPQRIGQAVSHGCIRMRNNDVVKLRALAPL